MLSLLMLVYLVARQQRDLCFVAHKALQEIAAGRVHFWIVASMVIIESGEAKKVGVYGT